MQRNCQLNAGFLSDSLHIRHNTGSWQRHPAFGNGNTVTVCQQLQSLDNIINIMQRFAHSHHHNIGNHPVFTGCARPFMINIAHHHKLADNFSCRQIAGNFLRPSMTESAADGTADLGWNTNRTSVCFGNINRFNPLPVGKFQQPFVRFITRKLFSYDFRTRNRKLIGQFGPQILWQIGHLVKRNRPLNIQPLIQLFGPKRLFADVCHQAVKLRFVQSDKFNFLRHLISSCTWNWLPYKLRWNLSANTCLLSPSLCWKRRPQSSAGRVSSLLPVPYPPCRQSPRLCHRR